MSDLPTNVDATYESRNAGDAAHQQHHDSLHALYNELKGTTAASAALLAKLDNYFLLLTGGTLTGDLSVPDEAYDATAWNGSLEVPTKNAVRDKIETLGTTGDLLDYQLVRKAADESIASNTTLQADDHLLKAVGANETWLFKFLIFLGASNATMDIKLMPTFPTSPTGWEFSALGLDEAATSSSFGDMKVTAVLSADGATDVRFGTTGGRGLVTIEGILRNGANAGNIGLTWAQVTSDVANLSVRLGSFLECKRIA